MQSKSLHFLELFAGGGGVACGLSQTTHQVAAAIEKEPAIAACYHTNHPETKLFVADIRDVTITQLPNEITAIWASPVCKQDSQARLKKLAPREDAKVGLAILPYLQRIQPELVILENVEQYQKNPALTSIVAYLSRHYTLSLRVLDAAHYGIPQSRRRLILQARRGTIALPERAKLRTWYEALADLFDTMEEADLANWQKQLWKPEYDALRPLMVYGHYAFRNSKDEPKQLDITTVNMPARTVTSSHNNTHRRIALEDGRILRLSPRENARLQTFPDNYIFPKQVTLASEIIGNAVPPLLVEKLTETYVETEREAVA